MDTKITVQLVSDGPMLMHSTQAMSPLHPINKAITAITSRSAKEKKLEENQMELARLEWMGGLYCSKTKNLGPAIPAENLLAAIRDAAKAQRLGTEVRRSVFIDEHELKLDYDGPRDPEALWATQRFADMRPVGVNGKKVIRTRPIFDDWSLKATISFDEEFIDRDNMLAILETAGKRYGLGDYRPRYGRFTVEVLA